MGLVLESAHCGCMYDVIKQLPAAGRRPTRKKRGERQTTAESAVTVL